MFRVAGVNDGPSHERVAFYQKCQLFRIELIPSRLQKPVLDLLISISLEG